MRRQDPAQLREQICTSAIQLFAERGYGGTSVQDIAEKVGISKQLLLYHYPSKEALRRAVLVVVGETWKELLPLLLETLSASPAAFEPHFDRLTDLLLQRQDMARVVMLELVNRGDLGGLLEDQARPWLDLATAFLRQHQAEGTFAADLDPEAWIVEAATLLLASIALLHLQGEGWPSGLLPEDWRRRRLREAIRILQASVRPYSHGVAPR